MTADFFPKRERINKLQKVSNKNYKGSRVMDIRVVLETGATSGIGKACAEMLAAKGYVVYGTGRRANGEMKNGVKLIVLDVNSDESVNKCINTVIS